MVKRIIIWVLVIGFAYFFFSTIAKSCDKNAANAVEQTGSAIGDAAESGANKVKEIASFEDDDLAPDEEDEVVNRDREDDDEYDINDEDDRTSKEEDLEDDEEDLEDESDEEEDLDDEDIEEDSDLSNPDSKTIQSASSSTKSNTSTSIAEDRYLVVAGSYREETNANIMVDRLKDLGYDEARVFSFDFAEYYSVTAGRFGTSSEASSVASKLKAKGIDCYPHKMRSKYFD